MAAPQAPYLRLDGSSIAGWKGIEASDMLLLPDPTSAHLDPFFAQSTVAIVCDVLEPTTGQFYEHDLRGSSNAFRYREAELGCTSTR